MKKRALLILIWTFFGALVSFGGWFLLHFYILFPNSDDIFAWKHRFVPELVFYTDKWGYEPGEEVQVFASWRAGDSVELVLFDVLQKDSLLKEKIWVSHQAFKAGDAIKGCSWKPSHSFEVPQNLETGWYILGLVHKEARFYQSIFLQPRLPQKRIAILLSTNTWNAYNFWGGHSIYSRNKTDSISFFRPQPVSSPFIKNTYPNHQLYFQAANKDKYVASLLDSSGYAFDVYSMEDLQAGKQQLYAYDAWILSTHTEYWSREMLTNLNSYLDSGGSLINLAGNVAAYESYLDREGRQLKVHRAIENLWEERDTTDLRPFGLKPGFLGFHTYAPYQIGVDSSWLLKATGLQKGDLVGPVSDSYDYTYMYGSIWDRIRGLARKGKMGAASGLEIDQVYEGTPAGWISVAAGLNPRLDGQGQVYPEKVDVPWKKGEGGFIGYYPHPGGGIVFGVGSMAFTGALPYDWRLRQMVLNVLEKTSAK